MLGPRSDPACTNQVLVRVRPANETELMDGMRVLTSRLWGSFLTAPAHPAASHQPCLNIMGTRNLVLQARGKDPYVFKFDQVLSDSTQQEEVFDSEFWSPCPLSLM